MTKEEYEILVEERKQAYREHWVNTQKLVEVEKIYRNALDKNAIQDMRRMIQDVEYWRVKVEDSKRRAFEATQKADKINKIP